MRNGNEVDDDWIIRDNSNDCFQQHGATDEAETGEGNVEPEIGEVTDLVPEPGVIIIIRSFSPVNLGSIAGVLEEAIYGVSDDSDGEEGSCVFVFDEVVHFFVFFQVGGGGRSTFLILQKIFKVELLFFVVCVCVLVPSIHFRFIFEVEFQINELEKKKKLTRHRGEKRWKKSSHKHTHKI